MAIAQVKRPLVVPDDINEAVECDTGFTKQDIGDFEVVAYLAACNRMTQQRVRA